MKKIAFTMAGGGQAAPIFGWMARRVAFTMADRLARTSRECRTKCKLVFCELSKTSRFYTLVPSRFAFTMAEILLSLTIIGVVAAITLPSLMGNINERTWNTQRKALHARMSQAIAMLPQLGGYYGNDPRLAAETFLTEGLSKVLKINNICDFQNLEDCGLPSTIHRMNGGIAFSSIPPITYEYNSFWLGGEGTLLRSGILNAAFETQNGESILVMYNPQCKSFNDYVGVLDDYVCANFLYDLNGNKGPNTVGKDMGFMTALYSVEPFVVAPMLVALDARTNGVEDVSRMSSYCAETYGDSRSVNIEEAISLVINGPLAVNGLPLSTNTKVSATSFYLINKIEAGVVAVEVQNSDFPAGSGFCIRR